MPRPRKTRTTVRPAPPRKGDKKRRWRLRITGPGTDTAEQTRIPYGEATRLEVERLAQLRERELNGESGTTVGDVLAAYHQHSQARHAPGTAAAVARASRWAERAGLAAIAAEDLDGPALLRAQDLLFGELKGATAKSYWATWRRAWRWARGRGLVEATWPPVSAPALKPADRTQKRALTEAEVESLLEFAQCYSGGRYYLLIRTLAETAARVGELLAADRGDLSAPPGGPAKLRLLHTKTGEPRTIDVSPLLAPALAALGEGPLFPSVRGGRLAHSTVHNVMIRWRRQERLDGQVDLHSLRRYAIARMERLGVPRAAGRGVSGHRSSAVYDSYANKGAYDVLSAAATLWLGQLAAPCVPQESLSHLSQDPATLGSESLQPPGVSRPSRGLIHIPVIHCGTALAGRRAPACPTLLGFLERVPSRLAAASEALRLSLGALPDAEE